MEMRRLGSHGPEISVIGFGAWEAGSGMWQADRTDDDAVAAMRAALRAGINWIDTAEVYGDGRSEELVGQVVAGRRDEVLVFTKVNPWRSGTRPDDVPKAIRDSLARLRMDHVDLYQVHWPADGVAPLEDTWGAMAQLVDEGLTRWIGVSNFRREQIERCEAIRHVDSVQNWFSLLKQRDRHTLLPWLAERGIGYLGYAPLAFGLLTGTITRGTVFDEQDWRSGTREIGYYDEYFAPDVLGTHLEKVDQLQAIADRLGVPTASLALGAAAATPGVTGLIAGSQHAGHTAENARAADLEIDDATLAEIDAIFRPSE